MATVAQIRVGGLNAPSGVYQLRLNFNGSKHWDGELSTLGGTYIYANWDYAVVTLDKIKSSRPTAELQTESGELGIEFNDAPNLQWFDDMAVENFGPIFREHLEEARANGITVHAILGRYDDVTVAVTEFCFAGSMEPSNYSVSHRLVNKTTRRYETVKCTFSPAARLDVKLSEIVWAEADMEKQQEFIASIVCEPECNTSHTTGSPDARFDEDLANYLSNDHNLGLIPIRIYTAVQSYGTDMHSRASLTPNPMLDSVGNTRTFPAGNWGVRLSTIIRKSCEVSGIAWDGNLNKSMTWPVVHWNGTSLQYEQVGETTDPILNFNLALGFNYWDGTTFKSPATWDSEMVTLDVLRGAATQLGCWCDLTSAFDADGQPILTFVPLDAAGTVMPSLDPLPDSSEDVPITDKDGVSVTRRGFDGAIIAPANALNPVAIEVPFGTHAMGYETNPAYDASRFALNAALDFKSQWKCGHRGAFTSDGLVDDGSGGRIPSLNSDGWVVGSLMFDYEANGNNTRFPTAFDRVDSDPAKAILGYHDDGETCYQADKWAQYYVVHASYESGTLTDDEKKLRQQHEMLAHAIVFARTIRGQRKQLQMSFRGVVAPTWAAIALTQLYKFTPVLTELDYRLTSIERDIIGDEIHCMFEELIAVTTEAITWRIVGKEGAGNGSIGGNASSSSSGSGIDVSDWDEVRPAQITTNTNDWNAGQTGKTVVYVNSSAPITLTGITNGKINSFIILINNGTHPITLMNENVASVAANRFIIPGISGLKSIGPNGVQWLLYDATALRWRLLPS